MIEPMTPPPAEASARAWVLTTLVLTLVIAAVVAATNRVVNRYGVFGDAKGRELAVGQNERLTKYLFAFNYIPSNFNGLLIGSSITDNWRTAAIHSYRVYNASISGANISEELSLATTIFARRRVGVTIVTIHPYLTITQGSKSESMRANEYWGALGSVQLFETYVGDFFARHTGGVSRHDAFGRFDFPAPAHPAPTTFRTSIAAQLAAATDSIALRDYGEMLAQAHASSDYVIGVIPPVSGEQAPELVAAFAEYALRLRKLFGAGDSIIDFNTPEYAAFRADASNYADGVHLTSAAATKLSSLLGARVDRIIAATRASGRTR